MIRRAFRMSIHRGQAAEYERRHDSDLARARGDAARAWLDTFTIFLDDASGDLFAYVEFDSQARWDAVANTEVCRRWWRHMREIMPSSADDSPESRPLREVFHIERGE